MPRQRGPASLGEDRKTIVQPRRQPLDAEQVDPRRGEFDGERDSVQPVTDIDHGCQIIGGQFERIQRGRGAFGKKLDRRKTKRFGYRRLVVARRHRKRREVIEKFAFAAQRLAAGGEQMNAGGAAQQALRQHRHRIERMFAIIEYDQHRFILKMRNQRGNGLIPQGRQPKDGRHRARNQARVRQRGQFNEAHPMPIRIGQMRGDGEGHGGLADAAGADHRHKPTPRQLAGDGIDAVGPADHARDRSRQMARRFRGSWRQRADGIARGLVEAHHRCHEAIAAARHGADVLIAGAFVAEQFAQGGDVDAQVGLFDEGVRPDPLEQVFLADQVFSAVDQRNQQIQRPAAEPQRLAIAQQNPACRIQPERPKR